MHWKKIKLSSIMSESISFGTWLRQHRRSLDLTQKALADQVGCAEITIRRMEADEYKPSNELALVLFEKLGIPEPEVTNKMMVDPLHL